MARRSFFEEHGMTFLADGRRLIVSARDGALRIYDLEHPEQEPALLPEHEAPPDFFECDPTGNHLVAVSSGKARVLDSRTRRSGCEAPVGANGGSNGVASQWPIHRNSLFAARYPHLGLEKASDRGDPHGLPERRGPGGFHAGR
jgi:hypothetical protein